MSIKPYTKLLNNHFCDYAWKYFLEFGKFGENYIADDWKLRSNRERIIEERKKSRYPALKCSKIRSTGKWEWKKSQMRLFLNWELKRQWLSFEAVSSEQPNDQK